MLRYFLANVSMIALLTGILNSGVVVVVEVGALPGRWVITKDKVGIVLLYIPMAFWLKSRYMLSRQKKRWIYPVYLCTPFTTLLNIGKIPAKHQHVRI